MHSITFDFLAVTAYFSALTVTLWSLRDKSTPAHTGKNKLRWLSLGFGWLAVSLQTTSIVLDYDHNGGPNFSFISALALVTLIITTIILLASIVKPVDKLRIIAFPLAGIILSLSLGLAPAVRTVSNHSWEMQTHIFASLLAYSFLNIAAIPALLLAAQDWCLKHHHPGGLLLRSLPSLQSMESMLFQLIGAGLLLLSLSLATGFAFMEDMFAQHLAHKTILSIIAWFVFATLLMGRGRYGWRGQTAIRWTLAGFASLMLAYFGTKMVLELILNRT